MTPCRLLARLARLRVDLTPWRTSPDFRILLSAGAVFYVGQWIGYVALPYQLYQLTGSNFAVGAMGLVVLLPLVVFGLYGGALADHVDRRMMLVVTGVAQALVMSLLLANALLASPQVWLIYLLGTYLVDMVGMFLAMPILLFPAFVTEVLDSPRLLGLLYSAEAVGALLATLTSGWVGRVHHGRAVVLATIVWGAAVGVAGLAPGIWFAIGCFVVAGGADLISGLFRGVIWNQTIPDEMRGRLAGIEMLSFQLGPVGGQVRSGVVADLTSVRTSIVSGGILCVAGVLLTAAWLRDFWRYDARTDEHAVRERELRPPRRPGRARGVGADLRPVAAALGPPAGPGPGGRAGGRPGADGRRRRGQAGRSARLAALT